MERKISYILFNLQCLAILVSFLLILFKTINNKRVTNYSLLIYIAFGFVIMFPMFLNTNGIVSIPYSNSINNASILIGFSILSFNMIRSISFKSFRMILGIIFCLQFSLLIYYLLTTVKLVNGINIKVFTLYHSGILLFAISFLISLLYNKTYEPLRTIESFWIACGCFMCSVICFPISFFLAFFSELSNSNKLNYYLSALPSIGFISLYLSLTKAYLITYKN